MLPASKAAALRIATLTTGARQFVVQLAAVTMLSSDGLYAVCMTHHSTAQHGTAIRWSVGHDPGPLHADYMQAACETLLSGPAAAAASSQP